jgi:bacterioferritin-associated ferredoxin
MYICICNAITDKQIRRAAKAGISNVGELRETLGVAANCGSCADEAQSILNESGRRSFARPAMYYPATA